MALFYRKPVNYRYPGHSATDGESSTLLHPFKRANFDSDIEATGRDQILTTADNFDQASDHCYKRGRPSSISAISRMTRHCSSVIPTRFLNPSAK